MFAIPMNHSTSPFRLRNTYFSIFASKSLFRLRKSNLLWNCTVWTITATLRAVRYSENQPVFTLFEMRHVAIQSRCEICKVSKAVCIGLIGPVVMETHSKTKERTKAQSAPQRQSVGMTKNNYESGFYEEFHSLRWWGSYAENFKNKNAQARDRVRTEEWMYKSYDLGAHLNNAQHV